jgi:SAM-dependent methyltransferase
MDVGCGDGAFLDLVKAAGMVTSGIELNKSGAEKALKKGHRVFDRLLHELNVKETGLFDVISLFQVLEHVSDPIAIIKDAVRLLNPDGIIAVAVPSAEGVLRLSIWDPHLWPPHHVSLWHLRDFDTLAGLTGLVVLKKGGDRLFGSSIKQLWKGHNALAASIGKGGFLGGNILPSITSFVFRKTGMKHLFSNCGNSIYAFFVVRK